MRVPVLVVLLLSCPSVSPAAEPFSVVMLPDTQHYSDDASRIVHFNAQTQWIVDNQVARNIVFSTLVGDIVENGGRASIDYSTLAPSSQGGGAEDAFHESSPDPALLVPGDNVLAVEIHQVDPDSSDISFDLELLDDVPSTLVPVGATWSYLDDGSDQGIAWRASAFPDGAWASGPAELGYGDGDEATVVGFGPDPDDKYVTTYLRHHFNVANPAAIASLTLRIKRDDGAVVYLNGTEVFRTNMWGTTAGNQVEWDRAVAALDTLDGDLQMNPDGLLPYAAVAGNHDYDKVDKKGEDFAFQYITNLGPMRYLGRSWFVGASPNQVNMAQLFQAGGRTYLNLGLEWHPSDAAVEWAQSVIAANPTVPTLITTHEHIDDGNPGVRRTDGETSDSGGDNSGESLYTKLIEPFPQVFMVLCGHVQTNGRIETITPFGQRVHEVLADYQGDPNGGNGWMQVLELRPDLDEIEFQTVSPTFVPGTTPGPNRALSPNSNFTLTMELDDHASYLASTAIVHFRQEQDHGFGVYTGTLDTHIGNGLVGNILPGVSYGDSDTLRTDGDGDFEQGLLRFEGLVGHAPGQIPPGTPIDLALLTVTSEGVGSDSADGAALHRMNIAWDETSTWDSLVGGVQVGSETNAAVDADTAGSVDSKGTDSFDVTTGLQAWVDGESNHGWVMVNPGSDDWRLRSSEWESLVERPMLTVSFPAGCSDGADNDGDGAIDFGADVGCSDPLDAWETESGFECDDGIDNDGDGAIDLADPACLLSTFPAEGPACDDDIDNDGDLKVDWDGGVAGTPDNGCTGPADGNEKLPKSCALSAEFALLLSALLWRRRRGACAGDSSSA